MCMCMCVRWWLCPLKIWLIASASAPSSYKPVTDSCDWLCRGEGEREAGCVCMRVCEIGKGWGHTHTYACAKGLKVGVVTGHLITEWTSTHPPTAHACRQFPLPSFSTISNPSIYGCLCVCLDIVGLCGQPILRQCTSATPVAIHQSGEALYGAMIGHAALSVLEVKS